MKPGLTLSVLPLTAEAFLLLERSGVIDRPLAAALAGMVGFRNVAVHQYEDMDMNVLRWIVESGHRDWIRLGEALGVCIRP